MKKIYNHSARNISNLLLGLFMMAMPFLTLAQISRTQVVNNALAYVNFTWTANSCNLWNGTYCGGANVYKAPWVSSAGTKTSMPYAWGGWSTTAEFNTAMSGCKSAGQVCSSVGGGCTGFPSAPLSCAGGHDCSGLVSRAWGLTSKYSTNTLPNISTAIGLTSTQPGDILNDAGSHVMLVETNNGNGNYQVIEARGGDWKCVQHSYTTAQLSGYEPRCPDPDVVDGGCSILAPVNDNCPGAITFPALQPGLCIGVSSGQTVSAATQSLPPAQCTGCNCTSTAAMDVWFKFTAINTEHTIQLISSSGFDAVIEIRKGPSCNGTFLQCYDPSGIQPQILYTYNNYIVGQVYYIRVFDFGSTPPTDPNFDICVASPASSNCNITSIIPDSENHNPEPFSTTPGADDIILNGQPNCTFTITGGCSWFHPTPLSGTMNSNGQAFMNYSIDANPYTNDRECTVYVNDDPFTAYQDGCTNEFYPSTKNVSVSGTTYILDVDSYSPCSWSITNNCSWVHLSQTSGSDSQEISVTVDPNTSCSTQTCTLTISPGNDTHVITQAGNQVPNQPSTISGLTNVCQGANSVAYSVTNVSGVNYSWTYSGSGAPISSGSGTSSITVNYSASATSGTWTVTPSNSCGNGTPRTLSVNVGQIPSSAGTITGSSTVCQGSNAVSYSVPTIANAETYIWQYSGTGHTINGSSNSITINFASNATPGNLTVKGSNTCGQGTGSPNFPIAVNSAPTANAGNDATICQTSTHTLSGTASNYSSVLWSTSGNGTFSSTSTLTPVYTPGTTDINNGTVTLTLTASAISPCTVNASDNKILIIQKNPTANAGTDASICQGSTYQLSGTAQYQSSVLWTTSGNGTFGSASSPNTVYTPGSVDITSGTVTLSLTASAISPCTVSANDNLVLNIQKSPIANAGADATICQTLTHTLSGTAFNYSSVLWTTSGDGTFSSASSLNSVYNIGPSDINIGIVTLTLLASAISPCAVFATDTKILTIQKTPTANAGPDKIVCESGTLSLTGTATNYSTLLWTTSGNGTFSSNSALTTVYTPGTIDKINGTVNLTLTANATSPCSVAASDFMILTIRKLPTANAGGDATISPSGTHTLAGTAANYATILWATSGNGTFSSTSSLTSVYTPGTSDISNGSVTLTLTASATTPCTINAVDAMTLTISTTTTDQLILKPGWNLISLDVIPTTATPASVFAPLIADNNLEIVTGFQNQEGVMFDPAGLPFLNSLQSIVPGEGYWVKVLNAATLNVTGQPISEAFSVNLKAGWNLIGYWLPETTTPEEAFAVLITAGVLEMVTGYDQGGQMYDPAGLPFLNTLTEIKNGFGYWVKLTANYNGFSYPAIWDCGQSFIDVRDGQTYETVQIGSQCWMKENLNIGTRIDGISEQTNNGIIEKYCYDNLETNCDVYGGLYQWDEMMQYSTIEGVQGICPQGWHVPTDAEWTTLTTYVSSQSAWLCNSNTTYIAKALAATTNWITYAGTCAIGNNLAANNASGFTGFPGGSLHYEGYFYGLSNHSTWQSSTEISPTTSHLRIMTNVEAFIYDISHNLSKSYGRSVRCLRD